MKTKIMALVFAGALAMSLFAGAAIAGGGPRANGADKAPMFQSRAFECETGASETGGTAFGFVVMNTNRNGDLIVQVSLKGTTPNATYGIWVNQTPGTCPLGSPTAPGALTTDADGNGNAHVVLDRNPDAETFWISAVGGAQVLRSTAVTLD